MGSTQSSTYAEFVGDRYDRLAQGVDVLALDPAIREASFPFDEGGLRALGSAIADRRLLDHLGESHANMVTALVLMDFHGGAGRLAARVHDLLAVSDVPPAYDTLAIVSGLAAVLALVVDTDAWLPATTGEWN